MQLGEPNPSVAAGRIEPECHHIPKVRGGKVSHQMQIASSTKLLRNFVINGI
jgi:hypothetical protein